MQRFLTLFPNAENVHLKKDIGMIPYVLYKEYAYNSTIACYENGQYPYLETDVKGLKHVFIERQFKSEWLNVCLLIFRNFREYDILQCYHISKNSIIYLLFFKFLKSITFSYGLTYLKFDLDDSIKGRGLSKITIRLLKAIDILSVETKEIYNYLNNCELLKGKVSYIPNGYYDLKKRELIDFSFKENVIITVGRIGSREKNSELLLESFKYFAKINLDWKLELIGPIEPHFHSYITNYFSENKDLASRVKFTGNISNRELLQKKYDKAKIFVLTSPREGFPLVFLEAIRSGCCLISPRFSSAVDVTCNEQYGALFEIEDSKFLGEMILNLINDPDKLEKDCKKVQDFASLNFSWVDICGKIDRIISGKLHN